MTDCRRPSLANGRAPPSNTCSRYGNTLDCEFKVLRNGTTAAIRVNYTPTQTGPIIVIATVEAREHDLKCGNDNATAKATAVR